MPHIDSRIRQGCVLCVHGLGPYINLEVIQTPFSPPLEKDEVVEYVKLALEFQGLEESDDDSLDKK